LPAEFACDSERVARLRREARTLASLNHPNIAAIYGLEESGDLDWLVLELVEGETLRGPLPIAQALDYARQIAEALEAAHQKRGYPPRPEAVQCEGDGARQGQSAGFRPG
jgi:serine/threonine protein kinase